MNAKDFKLSVVDRAIEIVRKSELNHAYSCFAIEQAAKEPFELEGGSPWVSLSIQAEHSTVYSDFAEDYFGNLPAESVVRREGDSMAYWWSTDEPANRYIPERVEFLGIFRDWLVEQGAQ